MNFYDILDITLEASQMEIVSQFRKLAHIHHPDKNNGESKRFILIQEAYSVLKDEKARKKYNKENGLLKKKVHIKRRVFVPTPDFLTSRFTDMKSTSLGYSDEELLFFKKLIEKKIKTANKDFEYLQGLISRKSDMCSDEEGSRYMTMEDGSLSMETEQLVQMVSRQISFIDQLEKALMRIENKTYGVCRVTGKLIDKERLKMVPHATLSDDAKMGS